MACAEELGLSLLPCCARRGGHVPWSKHSDVVYRDAELIALLRCAGDDLYRSATRLTNSQQPQPDAERLRAALSARDWAPGRVGVSYTCGALRSPDLAAAHGVLAPRLEPQPPVEAQETGPADVAVAGPLVA